MSLRLRRSMVVAALIATAGCDATYAPPVRSAAYGAPGRLDRGRVELSVNGGGVFVPQVVVPHVGYGVSDWLALEAGGNIAPGVWYQAFGGTRFSLVPHREAPVHFVGDLELGMGGGVGGERHANGRPSKDCPDCDGRGVLDRSGFGGYQGAGLGVKMRWFTLFARVRVEESSATNVPVTVWPSAMLGMEMDAGRVAAFTLGGGYVGYHDRVDSADGWFYQVGVTFFIDTRRPPR